MFKPLFVASLVSLGFLWACTSSDDADPVRPIAAVGDAGVPRVPTGDGGGSQEVVSEAGAANQAQACNTLPRTFSVAPKDYYVVYTSDAEAISSITKVLPKTKWIAPGSAQQTRGEAAVAKVFTAYQKLYPDAVAGMTAPRVIIANDTSFNAFAYTTPFITVGTGTNAMLRVPWVFAFNSGFFTAKITDDEIALVAAHEMGHLFLRNGNDDYFKHVHYRETPDEQGKIFGEYEMDEKDASDTLTLVKAIGERVGQAALPELNGIPSRVGAMAIDGAISSLPRYLRDISVLYDLRYDDSPEKPTCDAALKQLNAILTFIDAHRNGDDEIVLGADAQKLSDATATNGAALAKCFAHVKATYRNLAVSRKEAEDPTAKETIAKLTTEEQLDAYLELSKNEKDADAQSPDQNLVEKVLGLSAKAQAALGALYIDPTIKYAELREFTQEDDADEAAVRIAKILGLDAEGLATALLDAGDPSYATSCKAILTAGNVPKYGGAVDVHHGTCWRAYRNRKMKEALSSCPATWPGK